MEVTLNIPYEELNYNDWMGDPLGNHTDAFLEIITDKAAALIVDQIDHDRCVDLYRTISNKVNEVSQRIERQIIESLSKDSYQPITDRIAEAVTDRIGERYERSKQYRELKKQFEIESDRDINSGIRALISDIVKAEVRKIIKL